MKEKSLKQLKTLLSPKILIGVGAVGILLLLLANSIPNRQTSDKNEVQSSLTSVSEAEYEQQLEKRLTTLLSRVEGVGEVSVMVTLESGTEAVYAQAESYTTEDAHTQDGETAHSSRTNEYILIGDGEGSDSALQEKTLQPCIKGVAVVCSGANNITVVCRVTELVSTVLDIASNRIYVTN